MTKTYIGDSVYARIEDGELILTTENGVGPPSNVIILGPREWMTLKSFVRNENEDPST